MRIYKSINVPFYFLPVRREDLQKIIRASMLNVTPEFLSLISIFLGVAGYAVGYALRQLLKSEISYVLPPFFALAFYFLPLTYTYAIARSRKTNIELKLPHAITYMRSLCDIMPLYEIFKHIFKEKSLYGEVSEEFGFIVRDVELFGESVLKAMQNLMETTPSEALKEFLEGLTIVFESGGNMKDYMGSKVENIREMARKQLEIHMKTLEILAEVFVVFFVSLPVFLLVMLSTSQFLGGGFGKEFYIYSYFFLPVGGIFLIYLIDLLNIKEDLSVTRIERKGHFTPDILAKGVKVLDNSKTKTVKRFKKFSLKENYYLSLIFTPATVLITLLILKRINLRFEESYIALLAISAFFPLMLAFEYRAGFVRKVEKEIPDLLRKIINLKDVGLTLQDVIRILKESKLGVLSREIKFVAGDIEWGSTVGEAFVEFVNRVGVAELRRAISTLVKASEFTENIRDVVLTTIDDLEYGLKMKNLRFTAGFAYLVIIYVSFFVLMYTVYTIEHSFLPNLSSSNSAIVEGLMYRTTLITAFFSGIIAGQMEKGHVLHGLKHVFVFFLASLILFEFLI